MLNGKSILVTGGTGSFGRAFLARVLKQFPDVQRIVVFSRDELKQFEMSQTFSQSKYPAVRYFIGDVRDGDRLRRACEGIDVIVHAAALKQVPAAEYNPSECIKTNIIGAENLIEAAMANRVQRVVALSTDKAASPVNLYGATKLCSDKLFTAANNIRGNRDIRLSVVRYGNVMGSRGSVVPYFLEKRKTGTLPITDTSMTRFNITLDEGVDMVLHAMEHAWGGEILVPKIPSYNITTLAEAIGPNCGHDIVGMRPGEKIHEEMISSSDSYKTIDLGKYFAILPVMARWSEAEYIETLQGKRVEPGFCYSSGGNSDWLTVDQIRYLIREHVDPSFEV